ncbi:MAG TPA: hypothetical protein VHO07_02555 [Streptosporangiaceae bacterium]|jgi:hypothetical protein|nr:hypothetical protein [Streptosporangiaceae bacterium]
MFATNCGWLEIFAGGTYLVTATPDRQRFGHRAYPAAFADLSVLTIGMCSSWPG